MKNDKYLRFIFTVIAICLVLICIRDIAIGPSSLFASDNGMAPRVWVDGGQLDFAITSVDAKALYQAKPISVRVR